VPTSESLAAALSSAQQPEVVASARAIAPVMVQDGAGRAALRVIEGG
jgi:hypothetical protein